MDASPWTLLPTVASLLLYLSLLAVCFVALRRKRRRSAERAPTVTILKPLAGDDDELEQNLASFAALDYPRYEVLLGVASADDAAYPVARRFVAENPHVAARLVITERDAAVNPKVSQLVMLERAAKGEVVVVSDSNVRVPAAYLWSLVAELEVPGVGLVTSLFVGTGERTVGAALENLQLAAIVAPGIVASSALTKRPFTVGKSMAMRRRDLTALGGFSRVGGVLAEDHALGRVFMDHGFCARTSLEAVENRNVGCTVRRTLERHTRWAKMRRSLAPLAFTTEPLLSPIVVATFVAFAAPSRLALLALLATLLVESMASLAAVRVLRGRAMRLKYAPLAVLRAYLVFFCWARACVSRRIDWRGNPFVLGAASAIEPAPPSSWSRIRAALRRARRTVRA